MYVVRNLDKLNVAWPKLCQNAVLFFTIQKHVENVEMEHLKISKQIKKVENDRHALIAHINGLLNASEKRKGWKIKMDKVHDQGRIGKKEMPLF